MIRAFYRSTRVENTPAPYDTLTLKVYYPAVFGDTPNERNTGTIPADTRHSPFPVVVFFPGVNVDIASYAWLAIELAKHNNIVVLFSWIAEDFPGSVSLTPGMDLNFIKPDTYGTGPSANALHAILDEMQRLNQSGLLAGLLDLNRIFLGGHSAGGTMMAMGNAGGTVEDRQVDETYRNYGVGISHNMRVNDNNLLIFGLAVGETKHSYERGDANDGVANAEISDLTEKVTVMPIFFGGLETDATSWLKLRMGATNALTKTSDEQTDFTTASSEEKFKFSSFDFSLGAGIRWNNLDVDFTVNEAFPLSGGFIMSGDEATPVTRASATYHY
jgi:hypothetical protein